MSTKLVFPLLVVLPDKPGDAATGGSTMTNTYAYGNPKWLDLLTGFNDEPILYEGQTLVDGEITGNPTSGNPISYYNGTRWEFAWQNGRQLASASSTDSTGLMDTEISYEYDINGLRTSKTVVTSIYEDAPAHNYVPTVIAPTCTEDGYTLYRCDCGDSYQDDAVPALGHDYTVSGNVYTCTRCGHSYTAHTHEYTTTVIAPTCLATGYTLYSCDCGDSYRDNIVAALGHSWVLESLSPAVERCTRCGMTRSGAITPPVNPDPPVEYGLRNGSDSERTLVSMITEHHGYIYASGKLLQEVITTTDAEGNVTTEVLDFTYDTSGNPYSLTYNGTTYYYVVNLQGDVIRLVSGTGATVAEYRYGPYGEVLTASGTMAEVNPLRYRGYYADAETEFYYLQSRYYDPVICRFVSADSLASTGQGFFGYNMFAYCGNCPEGFSDSMGHCRRAVFYEATEGDIGFLEAAGYSYATLIMCEMPYCTVETYTYSSAEEFIEAWNSLSGTYGKIVIFTHGSSNGAALWFAPTKEYLHVTGGEYNFSMLESADVSGEIQMNTCYAGKEYDGGCVAQAFADLTGGKVIAADHEVTVCSLFGISWCRNGEWHEFYPRKQATNGSPKQAIGGISRKRTTSYVSPKSTYRISAVN